MGNFYTNIVLKTADQEAVVARLTELKRQAFVSPVINGYVTVYDAQCEEQNPNDLKDLTIKIAGHFKIPAIAFINHDDDVLLYGLQLGEQVVDVYNSSPGYFSGEIVPPKGGGPEHLRRVLGVPVDSQKVDNILKSEDEYVFAFERHKALVDLLGLPIVCVGTGYTYISEGEIPEGYKKEDFVEV